MKVIEGGSMLPRTTFGFALSFTMVADSMLGLEAINCSFVNTFSVILTLFVAYKLFLSVLPTIAFQVHSTTISHS